MNHPLSGGHEAKRRRTGYLFAALTVVTCPCHLPILLALLAGTAAGTLLSEYAITAVVILSLLFAGFLAVAFQFLGTVNERQ